MTQHTAFSIESAFSELSEVDLTKYPMLSKMAATPISESVVLTEFLDFLRDAGMLNPNCPGGEQVLAGFYEIDVVELMKEQDRLYQELHEKLVR